MTVTELRRFEARLKRLWEEGRIKVPVHLCDGNEEALIELFEKNIRKGDYVFSNHRNSYHYLLHGGDPKKLIKNMISSRMGSMNTSDRKLNFFASAIVGGCCGIAVGVAWALKRSSSKNHVFCFVGDAVLDGGHFWEALQYAQGYNLPITFVIEDNNRSTCTPTEDRLGAVWNNTIRSNLYLSCNKVMYYKYMPEYPHCGSGKYVSF